MDVTASANVLDPNGGRMPTTISLFLYLLGSVIAQDGGERRLTVEEYLALTRPTAIAVAPDGRAAAIAAESADLELNRFFSSLHIWRAGRDVEARGPRFAALSRPRWSPTGTHLAFLADNSSGGTARGGEAAANPPALQLWIVGAARFDDPRALTDLGGGVIDYAWSGDSAVYILACAVPDSTPALWRVFTDDGTANRVWDGDPGIREIALSPGGGQLVYSTNGSGADADSLDYDLRILDLATTRSRRLTDRAGPEVGPAWTADGTGIVFRAPNDMRLPTGQTGLFRVAATGGRLEHLTQAFDRSVLDHRAAGDEVIFAAAMGARTHLFTLRANGAVQPLAGGEATYGDFAFADGVAFAIRESGREPPELWRLGGAGPERLTDLNARARAWRLGRQELIVWRAPDGLSVQGVLVYPVDYQEGTRYPLLVHPSGGGGDRAADALAQADAYQLFADQGYAVLAPNVRGVSGYGQDFAAQRRRDLAGGHLADLMAGVAHVVELGIADSTRIGIFGTGHAGLAAGWVVSQTPRFGAAVIGYGVGGLAFPAAAASRAWSAQLAEETRDDARHIQAPLLLTAPAASVVGGDDEAAAHARELHRALRDMGKTVELVELGGDVAPDPRGRAELFLRVLRWTDRHLKLGGADLFEFYLAGESVPGPSGWSLRASEIAPVAGYAAVQPDSGRYLEIALSFQPEASRGREQLIPDLSLDPAADVRLLGPAGEARPLAGTVTELFGEETLILGLPTAFVIPEARRGSAPAVSVKLAFEIPDGAAVYRLLVEGFRPIRIWVPAANRTRVEGS